jgi:hypothetical protein
MQTLNVGGFERMLWFITFLESLLLLHDLLLDDQQQGKIFTFNPSIDFKEKLI